MEPTEPQQTTVSSPRPVWVSLAVIGVAAAVIPLVMVFTLVSAMSGGRRVIAFLLTALTLSSFRLWWMAKRTGPAPRPPGPHSFRIRIDRVRRFSMGALGVCAALTVSMCAANVMGIRPPAQHEVAARFREHRSRFEQLRDMVRADGVSMVRDGGRRFARESLFAVEPKEADVSLERADEYVRLLNEVGCSDVFAGVDRVSFPIAAWGMANRGWRLALMWSEREPPRLVPSVDGLSSTGGQPVASLIEDDWYVSFVW